MHKRGVPLDSFPINSENRYKKAHEKINWVKFNELEENAFCDGYRTLQPLRRIVSMVILIRLLNLSEAVFLERWIEVPVMQSFTGEDWFHWDLPITPEEIIESEKHFSSETKAFIDDAVKKIVKI